MTGRLVLVLAAGAGRRFGGGKLTANWRARPLVSWAVRAALALDVDEVRLVLGAEGKTVRRSVEDLRDPRLRLINARNWAEGQSASLRAGLEATPFQVRTIAVFLGDMPEVDPDLALRLFEAVEAGALAARPGHPDGPAHPIVMSADLIPDLRRLQGDEGGRSVLARLGERLVLIPTLDRGAVFDVDTPADLAAGGRTITARRV